jgi:Fic family protein
MPPVEYHYGQFPPKNLDWDRLVPLLNPASTAIARYDGMLAAIPNANVLLSPLSTREAMLSARIEGTITTMSEVFEFMADGVAEGGPNGPRAGDIQEVINYRRAIWDAADNLKKLPMCLRIVREAHAMLMSSVRGKDKAPGDFRKTQNLIGLPGSDATTARFLPIRPDQLEEGLARWEAYLHSPQKDPLVHLAIIHAEFESLHPFHDGNGRVGRMLVPLLLVQRGMLSGPTFYVSAYLEAQRQEYYDRLLAVSREGDWTGWCEFFLRAMQAQGEENTRRAKAILAMYDKAKSWIPKRTRSQYAIDALDFVFNTPVFKASDFCRGKMPPETARGLLKQLQEGGMLKVIKPSAGRRAAVVGFTDLLAVADGVRES